MNVSKEKVLDVLNEQQQHIEGDTAKWI